MGATPGRSLIPGHVSTPDVTRILPTNPVILFRLIINCNRKEMPNKTARILQCLGHPVTCCEPQTQMPRAEIIPPMSANGAIRFMKAKKASTVPAKKRANDHVKKESKGTQFDL